MPRLRQRDERLEFGAVHSGTWRQFWDDSKPRCAIGSPALQYYRELQTTRNTSSWATQFICPLLSPTALPLVQLSNHWSSYKYNHVSEDCSLSCKINSRPLVSPEPPTSKYRRGYMYIRPTVDTIKELRVLHRHNILKVSLLRFASGTLA